MSEGRAVGLGRSRGIFDGPVAALDGERRRFPAREVTLSRVRVLVGTRKGAFILTSDGKRDRWEVSGPHFAGWEIYHLKGSPVDPDRILARIFHPEIGI